MKLFSQLLLAAGMLGAGAFSANAAGWPSNYDGVMLQGFSWDNYTDTKWTTMTANSDELSTYFDLIWVPNSGYCGGHNNMGYMPIYWFSNHNSSFGTETELRNMIATFKAKGTGIIEDVVINHRNGVSNWSDFPAETWNGQTWKIGLDGICNNDEMNWADGQPKPTGAADTGENFDGARDLDHTNANVQNNCKNYCKFLLEDLGYVGFRYDMVKGYSGYYTGMYNEYSQPAFSVGEYWDGQYDAVAAWIEATGKRSAAFDFPGKYCINEAFHGNDMTKLVWKANGTTDQPAGLIHYGYKQYAVTFVDNHDTYRDGSKFNGNVMAANAFILCSPGTPCVFLEHYKQNKAGIQALIKARKAAGVHNNSAVKVLQSSNNCYMAEVTGSKGKLVVKVGSAMVSPSGYSDSEIVTSGTDYCVWVKTNGSVSQTAPATLYVMGDLAGGSWKTNGGVKMTKSGNSFSAQNVKLVSSTGKAYFSFAVAQGANWNAVNAANRYGSSYEKQAAALGTNNVTTYEANVSASSCASWEIAPGSYNFSLNFDNMTLTITKGEDNGEEGGEEGGGDDPIVDPTSVTIYFDNSSANWTTPHIHYWGNTASTWPGVAMNKVSGNIWKYECPTGTTGCLFNAGDGDATKTSDFAAVHNHIYTTTGDGGEYDPEYIPGMPSKLYLIGNLSIGQWSTSNVIEMTKNGSQFEARSVRLVNTEDPASAVYFSFVTTSGDSWNAVNGSNRYGAETTDEEIIVGGMGSPIKLYAANVDASSAKSWMIESAGTYDIFADFAEMEVSVITSLSGVETIDNEASIAPAVYYNLQGVRVENPGHGLYIEVRGGKAYKVVL